MQTQSINLCGIPGELPTIAIGAALGGIGGVVMQAAEDFDWAPNFMETVVFYGGSIAFLIGTVATVYSMVRLCERVISKENSLCYNITIVALGALATAVAETIGHKYSWGLLATSFIGSASMALAIGGIVFTAYATYRTVQFLLAPPQAEQSNAV